MFRVALDAMGGDNAPSVPVSGAVAAAQKGIATVLLVGDEKKIRSEAILRGIPIITTESGARATLDAIRHVKENGWSVKALQDYFV